MKPQALGAFLGMIAGIILILLITSLLWIAGEQHRANCISLKRVQCSVLPWDQGQAPDGWGTSDQQLLRKYGYAP